MVINIPKQGENLLGVIRKIGYSQDRYNHPSQQSFSRSLQGTPYPRFHIYIEDTPDAWIFKLHLDQKKPSYKGSSAHAGEYGGEVVEKEALRIKELLI